MRCHPLLLRHLRLGFLVLTLTGCSKTESNHETAPQARYGQPRQETSGTGPLDTPVSPQLPLDGTHIGNGGDVLVCVNNDATSYEVLDSYEERVRQQVEVASRLQASAALKPVDLISTFIANLSHVDPLRAARYGDWVKSFPSEAAFLPNTRLAEVEDSSHISVERNCTLQQLVVQVQPATAKDKRYWVDKDLWDKLDARQQAIMTLHEIIYRDAIQYGINKSPGVRLFNAHLFSGRAASWDLMGYLNVLQVIGFKSFSYGGVWLQHDLLQVRDNKIVAGNLEVPQKATVFGAEVVLRCLVRFDDMGSIIGGKLQAGHIPFTIGSDTLYAESSQHLNDCNDKSSNLDFYYQRESNYIELFSEKSTVTRSTADYLVMVSGFMHFSGDTILRGQVSEGTLRTFGSDCKLLPRKDVVWDPRTPTGLLSFSLQPCIVSFGQMPRLWVRGESEWRSGSFLTHLTNDQVVSLAGVDVSMSSGANPPDNALKSLDDGSIVFGITTDTTRLLRFILAKSQLLSTCDGKFTPFVQGTRLQISPTDNSCIIAAETLVDKEVVRTEYPAPPGH